MEESLALGHWRTSDGAEVDLVAELDDGQVLAFELKANQRATGTDASGLQQLRDALGPHPRRRDPHDRTTHVHAQRPHLRHAHRPALDTERPRSSRHLMPSSAHDHAGAHAPRRSFHQW
jgi:hypothetical protein